jgi:hypothetical protein
VPVPLRFPLTLAMPASPPLNVYVSRARGLRECAGSGRTARGIGLTADLERGGTKADRSGIRKRAEMQGIRSLLRVGRMGLEPTTCGSGVRKAGRLRSALRRCRSRAGQNQVRFGGCVGERASGAALMPCLVPPQMARPESLFAKSRDFGDLKGKHTNTAAEDEVPLPEG